MRVEDIEIHVGEPAFSFTPIRRLEAKCEATTAFSGAPSMNEVNAKLREMAVGVGANAIIHVEYKSGMSLTSWRSMTGTGLAISKQSDEIACPSCAELIKRAAVKCRFCGAEMPHQGYAGGEPAQGALPVSLEAVELQEPLKATNNPQMWLFVLIGIIVLFSLFSLAD